MFHLILMGSSDFRMNAGLSLYWHLRWGTTSCGKSIGFGPWRNCSVFSVKCFTPFTTCRGEMEMEGSELISGGWLCRGISRRSNNLSFASLVLLRSFITKQKPKNAINIFVWWWNESCHHLVESCNGFLPRQNIPWPDHQTKLDFPPPEWDSP